jgi:hypothetical protein
MHRDTIGHGVVTRGGLTVVAAQINPDQDMKPTTQVVGSVVGFERRRHIAGQYDCHY